MSSGSFHDGVQPIPQSSTPKAPKPNRGGTASKKLQIQEVAIKIVATKGSSLGNDF